MKNDLSVWTQRLARVWPYLAISVDIIIINHFVFPTPFSFGFHCACVISQDFPFHCPHMLSLILSTHTHTHLPLPFASTFAIVPSFICFLCILPSVSYLSFWAAWVVWCVLGTRTRDRIHTPNRKWEIQANRPMSVCLGEKDRNLQGGMQLDRTEQMVEDVK